MQVLLRRSKLHGGGNDLIPAEVVSQNGGKMTLKFTGELKAVTVDAKDTLPMSAVIGGQPELRQTGNTTAAAQSRVERAFPSRNSLFGRMDGSGR